LEKEGPDRAGWLDPPFREGEFFWVNGDKFWSESDGGEVLGGYVNFGQAEPDDFEDQDFVAMGLEDWPRFDPGALGSAGEWNDLSGANTLASVVEFSAIPEPSATGFLVGAAALVGTGLRRFRRAWGNGGLQKRPGTLPGRRVVRFRRQWPPTGPF